MKKKQPKTILFDELVKEWEKDPKFRKAWAEIEPEYQLARQIASALGTDIKITIPAT